MSTSSVRVLLIEDNPGDARLIREALRDVGGLAVDMKCAASLASGLERLRSGIDVVLVDLALPDSHGLATITAVRARAPDVPIIVLTGTADESLAVASMREGAQDYLIKGQSEGPLLARSIRYAIERHAAQRALSTSEARFCRLFESNTIGLIVARLDGTISEANDAFLDMIGHTREDVMHGRLRWDAITAPGYANLDRRAVQELEEHGVARAYEKEFLHRDGRLVPVRLGAALLPGTAGETICHVVDLTETRRAESRIRWLTKAVEQSPAAVVITDPAGTIEYVNERFTAVTEYATEDVLGQPASILKSGKTSDAAYRELWGTIAAGREWRGELRNRKKSGELYWDESVITPLRNAAGVITHFLAIQQDITRRKVAEEEIRNLNENLERHVLERTSQLESANAELLRRRRELQDYIDAMSTLNAKVAPDGTLLLVNRIAQQASGLPIETLLRTNFLDGQWWAFDAAVRARVQNAFRLACAGTTVSYEEKLFAFDKVVRINLTLVPVPSSNGRVEYIVVEAGDISRRVEVEEALKTANGELEAFTYSVSHDLRAPIRQIDGFSRILAEHLALTIDDKGRHYLSRIREGAHYMGRLVDDMLHLARVGRQDLRPQVLALDSLVGDVVAGLQSDIANRDIQWNIKSLPTVNGDPGLIKVLFTNLLANAVKYTRPRQVAVIEVAHTSRNGHPVLFVKDNGVGFDMQYADKLFGVFQRLHSADEFEGTGVGLATVQRIVHKHGGEIWAESEPERGAAFYFTLGPSGNGAARDAR